MINTWWLKIIAKLILSRLPVKYIIWKKLGFFKHGAMDQNEYAINIFNQHTKNANLFGKLEGKLILELGPGDSIATALLSYAYGGRAILIDTGNYIGDEIKPYLDLANKLRIRGLRVPDLSDALTVTDILDRCNAEYLMKGISSFNKIQSSSIDFIFSQAVLEHIKKRTFNKTIHECYRVLKPSGTCSHLIDLKDHLCGGLNHLRFNSKIWESKLFNNSGYYTNRLRHKEMIDIFRKARFNVKEISVNKWNHLPISKNLINQQFQDIHKNDLLIKEFEVLLFIK